MRSRLIIVVTIVRMTRPHHLTIAEAAAAIADLALAMGADHAGVVIEKLPI